ncbi:MAG: radical SAM protein [Candidatus Woesearchaeota archaeon]
MKKIVLVRPPIYEVIPPLPRYIKKIRPNIDNFYSFASQSNVLLRISTYLKSLGHDTRFIDCAADLPISNPSSVHRKEFLFYRKCGNYENERVSFPVFHCGMSYAEFEGEVKKHEGADEFWVSCCMTYHWEAAHKVIEIIKKISPNSLVKLGGYYATLCEEHAKTSLADQVFVGELAEANDAKIDMDAMEYKPDYIILKSTRGCPNKCSYCAVHLLEGRKMRFRNPKQTVEEIISCYEKGIEKFYFWESNLLSGGRHFDTILDMIISSGIKIRIEAPEGLPPELLTKDICKKMKLAGVTDIKLPLETSDDAMSEHRLKRSARTRDFKRAVQHLLDAGYAPEELRAFILLGMPDQKIESVFESMIQVWGTGCSVKMMPFTPIPGTEEYKNNRELIGERGLEDLHPLLFPFANQNTTVRDLYELCTLNAHPDYFTLIKQLPEDSRVKFALAKAMKKHPMIWDKYYEMDQVAWENEMQPDMTVARAVKNGILKDAKTILDIGCGTGKNSLYLKKLGFDVYGIDRSRQAISKIPAELDKKNFIAEDFMDWQSDKKFDAAIDIGCFHMIDSEQRKEYVNRVAKLLKADGVYILRCFSEHGHKVKRFYPSEMISPFCSYLAKDDITNAVDPEFTILMAREIFWCVSEDQLVPGMYEFFLKRR